MYSKLPTDDELLIYSKHVEDIYWNKFKKKVHLVGSYYANLSRCTVRIMSEETQCSQRAVNSLQLAYNNQFGTVVYCTLWFV